MKRPLCNLVRRATPVVAMLAVATPAWSVSVNGQGVGQVLLYPYYTARALPNGNAYSTLFTVTNSGDDTKVVRVRFREGRNGRPVASVNVFLPPHDSWTGALSSSAGTPVITTADDSCTDPLSVRTTHSLPFSNVAFSNANADGEDATLSRAEEG